ncbi:hypothetical protein DL93DRAFT_2049329 [Clavulina sp. PMI_390]|nr:hypothetical protein DL93DRAFT_2049329 [Clavulina sp. PMI_390]
MASGPPYDLSSAIDFDYGDTAVSWNKRDTILYALSIGAHKDDFKVIYGELTAKDSWSVIPHLLALSGTDTDVFDFAAKFGGEKKPPGLPTFDPSIDLLTDLIQVQASQYYENLAPLPLVSTDGFKVTKKCVGIHEAADGVTFDNEIVLEGPDGKQYARMIAQAKYLGAKANGKVFDETKSIGFPPMAPISSLGKPSWTCVGPTWPEQSVLYRLNGDYNPLHIDPKVGAALGYGGLICHGLGMYSITARAILEKMSSNDPANLKSMTALFSGPITPGDDLQIAIWELGPAPEDSKYTHIAFEARNPITGKLCLGEGHAYIIKTTVRPEANPIASGFPAPQPQIIPANGPKPEGTVPSWVPRIYGIPVTTLATVLFFLPAIIANLLFVILSYVFTWWWQW